MIKYHVRHATTADLDACVELRRLTEQAFRAAGLDQWHDTSEGQRVIAKWINRGEMRVVTTHAGDIIACFALGGPDQDFWTEDEAREPALYLYKLIVRPDRRGSGLGEAILDYATHHAAAQGAKWVRIDCWKTNTDLHRYFTDRGFEHRDTRTAPGRNSGWLAQRPVHVRCYDNRVRLTDEPPVPVLGDRYSDPISAAWQDAATEIAALQSTLGMENDAVTAHDALDQAIRLLHTRANEQRQRNGLTYRPFLGQYA